MIILLRKRLIKNLSGDLSTEALSKLYNSFDIIGDIAILKTRNGGRNSAEEAAKQIMATHKNVKAVFLQSSRISGDFRTRQLKRLAGEDKTCTIHKESGCLFMVDVDKCYFSPRLSQERLHIASMVKPGETVVNMFAGVGCFSILIAKLVSQTKVYSIDVNPNAVKCMQENIRLNRVYGIVTPFLGDSKEVVGARLQGIADRVLMPLPEKALEYLPVAVSALKKRRGWIHYYDFEHATKSENPVEKTRLKVACNLETLGINHMITSSRIVRSTGPNWWQTALDIQVI